MNKQYKFKCPICGKWHDVYNSDIHQGCQSSTSASCMDAKLLYKGISLDIYHSSINGLLRLLRKLNIEVAEVCDKLKWKYNKAGWFESQEVVRNDKLGRYYVQLNTFMSDNKEIRVKDFEATFAPTDEHDDAVITFCYFDTEREAKAACQADFQKRRAR